MTSHLSRAEARRIALAAQGFGRPRPAGRVDARHLRRVFADLGLIQLDFVNVVVPAHYQVLFSRLGPYDRSQLDDLAYRRREVTEQWAHEASLVPADCWPLLAERRRRHRPRPRGFESFLEASSEYVDRALAAVRERGPLTADELPHPEDGPRRLEHAWFGSVRRAVLEAHFGFGRLAIADRRPDFARVYDLPERVIPEEHRERTIAPEEATRELLRRAARACGVATAGDLADYFRMPAAEAKPRLAELVAAGELHDIRVEGWSGAGYLDPDARAPRRIAAAALISPFDPLIWSRRRAERLFGFEHRFEIFVPGEKRRWGVYVLPFLLGDRLVARADLKAERAAGRLRVAAAYLEPGCEPASVAEALAAELRSMAGWLELGEVKVARKGDLARHLAQALAATGAAPA
jgi:hypothetical protein